MSDEAKALLDAVENGELGWDEDTRTAFRELLEAHASASAADAVHYLRDYIPDDAIEEALSQANDQAVAWAEDRIGNLITEVSDTTRGAVNELTASAIDNGWTNDEFAGELSDAFGFSDDRANLIATTETATAETAGTLEGYKASGVVGGKEWSADADACDDCAALDGVVVPLDEDFPGDGGDGPPAHPRCQCVVAPVVSEDALGGNDDAATT
jgi:SPP1 gp7 family putative phage head morphogenesis protein